MKRKRNAVMAQLTPENRRILRRMARYIASYSLNEVAYEELMSDLAGMALECQTRHQSFTEAVGMDEAAFCHELVANCPRKTRAERVLSMLGFLVAWEAAILPAMYLLEFLFPWMPGACDGWYFLTPASFLYKYFVIIFTLAFGLYFFKRVTYRSKPLVGGLYLLCFLLVFITITEVSPYLAGGRELRVSMIIWAICSVGALLLCYAGRRCIAMTVAYQREKHHRDKTPPSAQN